MLEGLKVGRLRCNNLGVLDGKNLTTKAQRTQRSASTKMLSDVLDGKKSIKKLIIMVNNNLGA